MVLSSLIFLLRFLPIFLISYFIIPKKYIQCRNLVLLIFSLIFYSWGEPVYISLMFVSIIFDYINGLCIEKFGIGNKKSKVVLIISIVGNLGLLCVFKYLDFFILTLNNIFKSDISFIGLSLPIGISFYTFQTLSYTIDVYRGVVNAEHNILNFATYVSMFPQLIAGPIVQFKTVAKELGNRNHSIDRFYEGIYRFIIGFIKKVFFGNNIGYIWNEIFKEYNSNSVMTLWLGIICFALHIYFDFSGYSDMAIGMGKFMGFNFLENFNYPYLSKSITEFWRRWHISLGNWFRDNLYIPLGGNKKGIKRQILNLFIVWFLTGLWHGASWNYILWGVYYSVFLIIEKIYLLQYLEKSKVISRVYTLFVILIGWTLFAIEDLNILCSFIKSLFGLNSLTIMDSSFIYYLQNYGILLFIGILASFYPLKDKYLEIENRYIVIFCLKNVIVLMLFIISISMLVDSTYNPFLYFRF